MKKERNQHPKPQHSETKHNQGFSATFNQQMFPYQQVINITRHISVEWKLMLLSV